MKDLINRTMSRRNISLLSIEKGRDLSTQLSWARVRVQYSTKAGLIDPTVFVSLQERCCVMAKCDTLNTVSDTEIKVDIELWSKRAGLKNDNYVDIMLWREAHFRILLWNSTVSVHSVRLFFQTLCLYAVFAWDWYTISHVSNLARMAPVLYPLQLTRYVCLTIICQFVRRNYLTHHFCQRSVAIQMIHSYWYYTERTMTQIYCNILPYPYKHKIRLHSLEIHHISTCVYNTAHATPSSILSTLRLFGRSYDVQSINILYILLCTTK